MILNARTGAPFQWAAIFDKEDINFTHGHHDLGWYDSSEQTCRHKLPCKVSCAYCRTPIMDEGRNMILLFPTLIDFKSDEDKENFKPTYAFPSNHNRSPPPQILPYPEERKRKKFQEKNFKETHRCCKLTHTNQPHSCHMFYPRRVVDIPDGKPKWSGLDKSSDLIEDSPAEMKAELKKRKREEEEQARQQNEEDQEERGGGERRDHMNGKVEKDG